MQQPLIVMIAEKKTGFRQYTIKDFVFDDIYKKCGFKQPSGFECRKIWELNDYKLSIHGKISGRPDSINDKPTILHPNEPSISYFGTVILLCQEKKEDKWEYCNLTKQLWAQLYNILVPSSVEDVPKPDDSNSVLSDKVSDAAQATIEPLKKQKKAKTKQPVIEEPFDAAEDELEEEEYIWGAAP